jgi:hypothetical protein
MKVKIYSTLLVSLWIAVVLPGCYNDRGNYDYVEVEDIIVEGIATNYDKITGEDVLEITPNLLTGYPENELEHAWILCQGSSRDTISRTRDLSYPVSGAPGNYVLFYRVRHAPSGYSALVNTTVSVGTLYSRGHYILKETPGGDTELDLLLEDGQLLENLLHGTQGAPLEGAPRSLGIQYGHPMVDPVSLERVTENCIGVITYDKKVGLYRSTDMYRAFDHESLFFEEPDDVPYRFLLGISTNDYHSSAGVYAQSMDQQATGKLSVPTGGGRPGADEHYAWSNYPMGGSFIYWAGDMIILQGWSSNRLTSATYAMPAPDHECLLMGPYTPTTIYALFRDPTPPGEYNLYTVRFANMYSSPSVAGKKTISSTAKICTATLRTTNERTAQMLYFVHDNKLYYYDVVNDQEVEINPTGLPAGETITWISNYHYECSYAPAFDFFAVATHQGGRYKLFLYRMTGGIPVDGPVMTATGEGKIKEMRYLAPGYSMMDMFMGSTFFTK